jgi:hypothetical protein
MGGTRPPPYPALPGGAPRDGLAARHRSEQYFTSSQTLAQALRQTIGRPQVAQVLTGRSPFLTCRATAKTP